MVSEQDWSRLMTQWCTRYIFLYCAYNFFHKAWYIDPGPSLYCCLLVPVKRHVDTYLSYRFFTKFIKKKKTSCPYIFYHFNYTCLSPIKAQGITFICFFFQWKAKLFYPIIQPFILGSFLILRNLLLGWFLDFTQNHSENYPT